MSEAFDSMRNFTTQHEKDDTPKKFCENCGREISIDAEKCDKCGFSFNGETMGVFQEETLSNKTKNFILSFGRFIVDWDTILGITIAGLVFIFFLLAMFGCFIPDRNGYFAQIQNAPIAFILAILIPLIILFLVVIWHYVIYLLIDIRDSLKNIEQNTRNK